VASARQGHSSVSRLANPGRSPFRLRIIMYSTYATIAPAIPKKIQGSLTVQPLI
jgi:hypothetical protein